MYIKFDGITNNPCKKRRLMPVGIALKEKCTLNLAIKQIILVKSVESCGLE